MDDRRIKHTFLIAIIIAEYILAAMLKHLGIVFTSLLANAIGSLLFCAPLVALLLSVSDGRRVKKHWRIILRLLAVHICVSYFAGLIVSIVSLFL